MHSNVDLEDCQEEKQKDIVLGFYCCCNRLPQAQWLEITQIYLHFWKSGVWQGSHRTKVFSRASFLSGGSSEGFIFLPLLASRGHPTPQLLASSVCQASNSVSSPGWFFLVTCPSLPIARKVSLFLKKKKKTCD